MRKDNLFFTSACEIADIIKRQELSALEIVERFIERIEKINPKINAYCTLTFEMAREQAKKADKTVKQGGKIGLLNGIPISIKDILQIKDVRTTFGSKIYENYIPDMDSAAVQRCRESGCVILGKTNTPEFGHKGVTDNLIFGITKNPWNLDRTPGGSSGGAAAAVVSGISPLAIGSDGGGSIRIPSSLCGCYGLKPNFGRVPRYPTTGISWATLSHYGPLVRYVEDAALMLDVMKGPHPADYFSIPASSPSYIEGIQETPKQLKIGYSLTLGFVKALDSEVEENVLNAVQKFEKMDWTVEEAKIKQKSPELTYAILITSGLAHDLKSKLNNWRENLTPTLVKFIEAGQRWTAMDLKSALLKRKKMFELFSNYFKDHDVLVTPTTAIPAFELEIMNPREVGGKSATPLTWVSFTYPFNMTGLPAASIPCGWTKEGLPVGMQIIGRRFDELTVLQASKAFQEIVPWQDKTPQLN
ncbi:MAG: amidase [Candidatus Helarchaeota archaeon]|nr:amidase [Candidatus Helarchaeota archaeon]